MIKMVWYWGKKTCLQKNNCSAKKPFEKKKLVRFGGQYWRKLSSQLQNWYGMMV